MMLLKEASFKLNVPKTGKAEKMASPIKKITNPICLIAFMCLCNLIELKMLRLGFTKNAFPTLFLWCKFGVKCVVVLC